MEITFLEDDLRGRKINQLLQSHLTETHKNTPPESVHALDVSALQAPDDTFLSAWQQSHLMAFGAIRAMSAEEAERKSMRGSLTYRGKGVGASVLAHIVAVAEA